MGSCSQRRVKWGNVLDANEMLFNQKDTAISDGYFTNSES